MLERMQRTRPFVNAVGNVNGSTALGNSLAVSCETKVQLPHNPAIALMGIYPREMKPLPAQTHSNVVTASCIIIKNWRRPSIFLRGRDLNWDASRS